MAEPPGDFAHDWARYYDGIPPLGHMLRCEVPDRWTRFHALPESKRLADTPAERAIILDRANRLADRPFGLSGALWLSAVTGPGFGQGPVRRHRLVRAMEFADEDPCDEESRIRAVHANRVDWRPGAFDRLFGEIAEDQERALFFDPGTGVVLAPYDGGFDIICAGQGQRTALEQEFRRWMSARPDKL